MPCESIPVVRQRIADIVVGDRLTAIVGQQLVFPNGVIGVGYCVNNFTERAGGIIIVGFGENVTAVVVGINYGLIEQAVVFTDKAVELVCP